MTRRAPRTGHDEAASHASRDASPDTRSIRDRMIAILLALALVAALKWSYAVTMPLAAAIFLMAAVWPIKPWLDRLLPSFLSYVVMTGVFFAALTAFVAAIYFATGEVVRTVVREQEGIQLLIDRYLEFAAARGLPTFNGEQEYDRLVSLAQAALMELYSVLGYLGLIAILVVLGLPEIPGFARRLKSRLHGTDRSDSFDALDEIASKFRQYVGLSVFTSLLTGVASGLWAFAIGLDLALIWGLLNFLLNFVPVIGNIVGILPPTLYAAFQFQNWTMPVVAFAGYAVIQITISNFVYPMLQGRGMALPSISIIVALSFWGWIWGLAGALLAVPLTIAFIIACQHFRSMRWIPELLLRDKLHAVPSNTGLAGPPARISNKGEEA